MRLGVWEKEKVKDQDREGQMMGLVRMLGLTMWLAYIPQETEQTKSK